MRDYLLDEENYQFTQRQPLPSGDFGFVTAATESANWLGTKLYPLCSIWFMRHRTSKSD